MFGYKLITKKQYETQKEQYDFYSSQCDVLAKDYLVERTKNTETGKKLKLAEIEVERRNQREQFRAEMSAKWNAMSPHGTTKTCTKCGGRGITAGTFHTASRFVFHHKSNSEQSNFGELISSCSISDACYEPRLKGSKEKIHDIDPLYGNSPNRIARTCGTCGFVFCERPADGVSGIEE